MHLIDNPDATADDLMEFVKGPDFPTGALILGRAGIDGRVHAPVAARSACARSPRSRKARTATRIVVTEIPYQTSVEGIERKIADLVNDREIEGVRGLRNESAKGKTKLVIELKKDANPLVTLNNLYKHTPMQTSFGVNMLALVDGVPRTLEPRRRAERLRRRTRSTSSPARSEYRLRKAKERDHIVEGLLRALDMIDAIITLIRGVGRHRRGRARA